MLAVLLMKEVNNNQLTINVLIFRHGLMMHQLLLLHLMLLELKMLRLQLEALLP
jgi:hypothetical protein